MFGRAGNYCIDGQGIMRAKPRRFQPDCGVTVTRAGLYCDPDCPGNMAREEWGGTQARRFASVVEAFTDSLASPI